MQVVLVHHADAVGPDVDPQRPLSPRGLAQAGALADAARAFGVRPDAIWHSGKLRARQTAEFFLRACNPMAEFRMVRGLLPDDPPEWMRDELADSGRTAVLVAVDGRPAGVIGLADAARETSAEAVASLHELGIEVVMLSGDNEATARRIAGQLGIDTVIAEVLPGDKAAKISQLQAEGKKVAMVGDGVNDAPALAQADLGIAIGTGADVAIAASDITLVGGDLRSIVSAVALSRRTVTTMKQGLAWAFGYNVLLIPVAAGALYAWDGLLLDPVLASAAMVMSSIRS